MRTQTYALDSAATNSNTLELDQPKHDCPAACVISQQVFLHHLVLMALPYPQGNIRLAFQNIIIIPTTYFLKV
jgi:hypothetical protein